MPSCWVGRHAPCWCLPRRSRRILPNNCGRRPGALDCWPPLRGHPLQGNRSNPHNMAGGAMSNMPEGPALTGTVFSAAHAALRHLAGYSSFSAGRSGRGEFAGLVQAQTDALLTAGVPSGDLPFIKRFPRHPHACAAAILSDLRDRGLVETTAYDAELLQRTEERMSRFEHGPFKTYIYPEEGLLLGMIVGTTTPRNAIFLGSYYGYWAHWAIPAILAGGGRVTLVDPDPDCCAVARHNLQRHGFDKAVRIIEAYGEDVLETTSD